jgi:hypothetical protein
MTTMNKPTVPAQRMGESVIDVGSWVKRSRTHTIEHLVTGVTSDGTIIAACGNRMRREPAVTGVSAEESLYRCVKCGEAEKNSDQLSAIGYR